MRWTERRGAPDPGLIKQLNASLDWRAPSTTLTHTYIVHDVEGAVVRHIGDITLLHSHGIIVIAF